MNTAVTPASNDEIDLAELWRTIWSGRWIVAAVSTIFVMAGVAYALLAQEWYRAEVVLAPADRQSLGGLGDLGVVGGIAALAGVDVPTLGKQHPVAVLKSRDLAREFIAEMNLMPVLLQDVRSSEPLDIRDAVEVFDTDVRRVTEDTRAGVIRLAIRWKDPDTAALWANALAQRLNERLRKQAAAEAERNVDYLRKEMAAMSIVSLQQSIGSLLEAQMQTLLLTRGNDEFAFQVIDRAVAPKEHDSPKRALVILISLLAGLFSSILGLALIRAVRGGSAR
jgi:uncharacterized protein involved in exopolysaccharide biosynthesis